jgi:HD-GYP domain-containing protein (c-di-GMP phosphodiesterase class II)
MNVLTSTINSETQTRTAETTPPEWDLKTLHRQINNLAYAVDRHELYCQALDILIDTTSAESATYFHLDLDTDELVVSAIRGDEDSQHLVGLRLPRQAALLNTQSALEPIVIGDLPGDPRWLRITSPSSAARLVNLISLPLYTRKTLIGVIQIYNYKQANLDYLELLCERIAVEVDRRLMQESTQACNQRLQALVKALGQIGGTLDRKLLLQTVLEQSALLVDAERTSIYINDPGTKEMSFQIAYQRNQESSSSNRSVINIPMQTPSTGQGNDNDTRIFGGLMVVKPSQSNFTGEDIGLLKTLTQQASIFLQAAEVFEGMEELFFDAIEALVAAMDAKDPYTQGHSTRVSEYSVLIAQELGLEENVIHDIRIGSLMHDVGKIGIPDDILKKKGKLTPEEWTVIRSHPLTGWNILHQVRLLEPMLAGILEHHEKLDGSGYPYGLRGDQISLMGRIVSVADVFDAMTSDRPYRKGMAPWQALEEIVANSGKQFDPEVVGAFKRVIRDRMERV